MEIASLIISIISMIGTLISAIAAFTAKSEIKKLKSISMCKETKIINIFEIFAMGENNEQKIKGNGNTQIIVNGDYNTGLDKNEVITIIKSF